MTREKGFFNKIGKIGSAIGDSIIAGLEAVAEMSEEMRKQRKEDSELRVRLHTNNTTARAYRQLIETTDGLMTREKERLVKELADYLGVSMVKERLVNVEVDRQSIYTNRNEAEWTQSEIKAFDEIFSRERRLGTDYEDMASKIRRFGSYSLGDKSLMQVQQRVKHYREAGL